MFAGVTVIDCKVIVLFTVIVGVVPVCPPTVAEIVQVPGVRPVIRPLELTEQIPAPVATVQAAPLAVADPAKSKKNPPADPEAFGDQLSVVFKAV